jgi:hypothetical protein
MAAPMPPKLSLVSLFACVAFSAVAPARHIDGYHPIIPLACDANPYAGEILLVTMPFGGTAPADGYVTVSSTSGNLDLLPSTVNYNSGDTSVSFYALIDPFATGSIQLSVSSVFGNGSINETLQSGLLTNKSMISAARF